MFALEFTHFQTLSHQVELTVQKEMAGFWVRVPCVEQVGSCTYEDMCNMFDMFLPPGEPCPEPLHSYGLPCHCPFKEVSTLGGRALSPGLSNDMGFREKGPCIFLLQIWMSINWRDLC